MTTDLFTAAQTAGYKLSEYAKEKFGSTQVPEGFDIVPVGQKYERGDYFFDYYQTSVADKVRKNDSDYSHGKAIESMWMPILRLKIPNVYDVGVKAGYSMAWYNESEKEILKKLPWPADREAVPVGAVVPVGHKELIFGSQGRLVACGTCTIEYTITPGLAIRTRDKVVEKSKSVYDLATEANYTLAYYRPNERESLKTLMPKEGYEIVKAGGEVQIGDKICFVAGGGTFIECAPPMYSFTCGSTDAIRFRKKPVEVKKKEEEEETEEHPVDQAMRLLRGQTLSLEEAEELRDIIDAASKTNRDLKTEMMEEILALEWDEYEEFITKLFSESDDRYGTLMGYNENLQRIRNHIHMLLPEDDKTEDDQVGQPLEEEMKQGEAKEVEEEFSASLNRLLESMQGNQLWFKKEPRSRARPWRKDKIKNLWFTFDSHSGWQSSVPAEKKEPSSLSSLTIPAALAAVGFLSRSLLRSPVGHENGLTVGEADTSSVSHPTQNESIADQLEPALAGAGVKDV